MPIQKKQKSKKNTPIFHVFLFGILCIFLSTSILNAFRPSASWLLNQAVKHQLDRKIKNLQASYQVTSYKDGQAQASSRIIYTQSPNLYAQSTENSDGIFKVIIHDQEQLLIDNQQRKKRSHTQANFWRSWRNLGSKVSQDKGLSKIKRALKAHGISLSRVQYKRLQGHICYVIGDTGSQDSAQLWLSKESLLPMQVSWFEGKDFFQLKLTAWNSPQGGEWLPQHTYLFKNKQMLEESHLDQVERNTPIPSSIFSF